MSKQLRDTINYMSYVRNASRRECFAGGGEQRRVPAKADFLTRILWGSAAPIPPLSHGSSATHPYSWRFTFFFVILLALTAFSQAFANDPGTYIITTNYSAPDNNERQVTVEFKDEWLLADPDVYNHKLMQASFGLAVSAYRDRTEGYAHKDDNVIEFLTNAGFHDIRTNDYHLEPSINTIASAIGYKKVGDVTLIVCAVSGGGYKNEWQSNLSVSDATRAEGFNNAAQKVRGRINAYIKTMGFDGELRLWISGYSRAAAVSNIVAADETDSGIFEAVFGYTMATPRTTKDTDAGRYHNIYNVINPMDPVPMVPFPEWGLIRYGTDLFLPSMETDLHYMEKKPMADAVFASFKGESLPNNPQTNLMIHTFMDFALFYINSTESYKGTFQEGILDIMKNKEFTVLLQDIVNRLAQLPEITGYQFREFGTLVDYILQSAYSIFRAKVFHPSDLGWNYAASLQENLMHEHYDEVYRCWLFASDDPDEIFNDQTKYIHYAVKGDVDIEFYDENEDFILKIDSKGNIILDPHDAYPMDNKIKSSPYSIFGFRQGDETIFVLPYDNEFYSLITSNKDQEIQSSYLEFNAKEIRADVLYIQTETLQTDEITVGNFNRDDLEYLSDDELLKLGFNLTEPWSNDVVYSAASIMRLENEGVFHPGVATLFTFPVLIILLIVFLIASGIISAGKGIVRVAKKHNQSRKDKKDSEIPSESAIIIPEPTEDQEAVKEIINENQ